MQIIIIHQEIVRIERNEGEAIQWKYHKRQQNGRRSKQLRAQK